MLLSHKFNETHILMTFLICDLLNLSSYYNLYIGYPAKLTSQQVSVFLNVRVPLINTLKLEKLGKRFSRIS